MLIFTSILKSNLARKTAICFGLITIAVITFGSSGGGRKNKNTLPFSNDFTTIRTSSGFTLKAGPVYRGSQLLNMQKQNGAVLLTSVVTYQRGNTTFILPYKYRMSRPVAKSNLNVVDIKINLHK